MNKIELNLDHFTLEERLHLMMMLTDKVEEVEDESIAEALQIILNYE